MAVTACPPIAGWIIDIRTFERPGPPSYRIIGLAQDRVEARLVATRSEPRVVNPIPEDEFELSLNRRLVRHKHQAALSCRTFGVFLIIVGPVSVLANLGAERDASPKRLSQ
jgi:hypothetical protein